MNAIRVLKNEFSKTQPLSGLFVHTDLVFDTSNDKETLIGYSIKTQENNGRQHGEIAISIANPSQKTLSFDDIKFRLDMAMRECNKVLHSEYSGRIVAQSPSDVELLAALTKLQDEAR